MMRKIAILIPCYNESKTIEKVVKDSERKIEKMESRLKELDKKLCTPEGASDMKLFGEFNNSGFIRNAN